MTSGYYQEMPDVWMASPRQMDARRNLTQSLRNLLDAQSGALARQPRELREIAAAAALVEMAKDLQRDTIRVARDLGPREGQRAAMTATGSIASGTRYSWAAIGGVLGVTPQTAHERWAEQVRQPRTN